MQAESIQFYIFLAAVAGAGTLFLLVMKALVASKKAPKSTVVVKPATPEPHIHDLSIILSEVMEKIPRFSAELSEQRDGDEDKKVKDSE